MAYIGRRRDPQRPPALPDPGVGYKDKFGTELTNPQYSGFSGLPDPGVQVTDQAGNITFQNPQYRGYTPPPPGLATKFVNSPMGATILGLGPYAQKEADRLGGVANEALTPWWNNFVADLDALEENIYSGLMAPAAYLGIQPQQDY